tara:strand:- start:1430 stop:2992 length:1563 start_codon:yes stop_codon:yes gene_type:complete
MAYQKVGGTPRFYIDTIQYLKNLDVNITYDEYNIAEGTCKELYNNNLSPENPVSFSNSAGNLATNILIFENDKIISKLKEGNCYLALLNHNLATAGEDVIFYPQFIYENDSQEKPQALDGVNAEIDLTNDSRGAFKPNENGFSLGTFNCEESDVDRFFFSIAKSGYVALETSAELYIGGVSFGKYYDMPINPDLDLSMSIEYDGFTNIKTLNGSTITQANYQGSPWWYDKDGNKVEPWSVGESAGVSKRNGRRVWKLKFSYMSDKDLFASNYMSNTYAEQGSLTPYEEGDKDIPNYSHLNIANPNFETDTSGWTNTSGQTFTRNTTSPLSGTGDLHWKGAVSGYSHVTTTASFPIVSGKTYKISFNYKLVRGDLRVQIKKSSATGSGLVGGFPSGTFLTSTTSTLYELEFTATESVDTAYLFFVSNNIDEGEDVPEIYLDNISIKVENPSDFYYTIDTDGSFSAQVLNKISHGEKFIFQPDNTSNNPSDFAICVLDGDSFDMKRVAPNVYDIEMTIREVW